MGVALFLPTSKEQAAIVKEVNTEIARAAEIPNMAKLQSASAAAVTFRVCCSAAHECKEISLVDEEGERDAQTPSYPLLNNPSSLKACYHQVLKSTMEAMTHTNRNLQRVQLKLDILPESIKICFKMAAAKSGIIEIHCEKLSGIVDACHMLVDEVIEKYDATIKVNNQLQQAIQNRTSRMSRSDDGDDEKLKEQTLEFLLKEMEVNNLRDIRRAQMEKVLNANKKETEAYDHLSSDYLHFIHSCMDAVGTDLGQEFKNLDYKTISKRKEDFLEAAKIDKVLAEKEAEKARLELEAEEKHLIKLKVLLCSSSDKKEAEELTLRLLKESQRMLNELSLSMTELSQFVDSMKALTDVIKERLGTIQSLVGHEGFLKEIFKQIISLSGLCFAASHSIKTYILVTENVMSPELSQASRAQVGSIKGSYETMMTDITNARKAAKTIIDQQKKKMLENVRKDIHLAIMF